ncbi:ABC transporter permease [Niallia sp. Krafla_26]|uniref:ABC transporter permease n=1 Tax=Niallia sp. Krafla_26 TaxID=3064703 RepID=UPI003D186493
MRNISRNILLYIGIGLLLFILFTFVIWPILKVVSFVQLENISELFTNSRWSQAALNSLFMTVISTLSCTFVAFIFAYTIARLEVPFKRLFKFITILPIVSPPFIVGMSYILLFGRQGIVSKQLLNLNVDVYGWHGLWLVQTITFFPYAYTVIYGVLKRSSPSLEYAAYNMGSTHWQVFKKIVLPLSKPGIAGGALIAAMSILADFGNPMVIGGNFTVLSTEAYMQMIGWFDLPSAAILSTTLLIPALCLFILNRKLVGNRSYTTVTGKESYTNHYPIPSYIKWSLFSFCMFITVIVLLVYGVLFLGAFTTTWGFNWSLTFSNIDYVFSKSREITNSIQFAVYSSLLAGLFSFPLAFIVQRKKIGIHRFIDFLSVLPGAIPGVFLGLGYAIAFNSEPLMLTGTAVIIVAALTLWNLPTFYSTLLAGLQQISHSLEEASQNLGGNSGRTFRHVLLPLLKGSFVLGMVVTFLRSVTCLSVIVFIYSAETSVGTVSILGLVSNGEWGKASAFTVVLISIAFAVLGLSQLFLRNKGNSNDY